MNSNNKIKRPGWSAALALMAGLFGWNAASASEFELTLPPEPICDVAGGEFLWEMFADDPLDLSDLHPWGAPKAGFIMYSAENQQFSIPDIPSEYGSAVYLSVTDTVAWDGYLPRANGQPNERYKFVFLKNGAKVGETSWTGGVVSDDLNVNDDGLIDNWVSEDWQGPLFDLADGDSEVYLPDGTDEILIIHWSDPEYGTGDPISNSLRPVSVCIAPRFETVSLGDRVWKDLNGDGQQDCSNTNGNDVIGDVGDGDPVDLECGEGIPGVPVDLKLVPDAPNSDCSDGNIIAGTTTNLEGFYRFDGLSPDLKYCVVFNKPTDQVSCVDEVTGIDLGDPMFTLQNVGGDVSDSDADPATGQSHVVDLSSGVDDLTIDAGIVCPVKIGDRVWEDDNDGLQDCSDLNGNGVITVDECTDTNIPGVDAHLYSCGLNMTFEDTGGDDTWVGKVTTDSNGMYMFGGAVPGPSLAPGKYYVVFDENTYPADYFVTLAGAGPDGRVDSECVPTACVDLTASGSINLDQDCGLVPPPNCDLMLDKTCRVEVPQQDFDKCDGKLKEFTVAWNGNSTITGIAVVNGTSVSTTSVSQGEELTVFGPFSDNDVEITFNGGNFGQSVFHTSCSDSEFNSPDDCGKAAGDGKDSKDGFDNLWTLAGFVDKEGRVLDCNGGSDDGFEDNCSFEKPQLPSCDNGEKPDELTWRYNGGTGGDGDCADSTFYTIVNEDGKLHEDFECSGSVNVSESITVMDDGGNSQIVEPGDTFKTRRDDIKEITLYGENSGQQSFVFHSSCSQPLEAGATAGALTLEKLDDRSGGVDVTYRYLVTNKGGPLSNVVVSDNLLGNVGETGALGVDGTAVFDMMTRLSKTTKNVGSATGFLNGAACKTATDTVTIEVTEPTCQVSIELDKIEDRKIKWKLSNSSSIDATIDDLKLTWEGSTMLKKVKFDGNDILKDVALPSGYLIENWQKEVKDRTLKAGDSGKTLEIEFTSNFPLKNNQPASDFDLNVNFEEGCSVTF